MPTLNHYTYDYYEGGTLFQPGQTRTYFYGGPLGSDPDGPWFDWFRKAVVASAQPFDATGQDRTLVVEQIRHRSIDAGKRYVSITIRNVGVHAAVIWYVTLGVVSA
ncbi:hypothetical protein ACI780_11770 [Geodermatophilus sp. SYSU D00814]